VGLFDFFRRIALGRKPGHDMTELALRLDLRVEDLQKTRDEYRKFDIPKRGGGHRRILAPSTELKQMQRRILRRLLGRLTCHPAAMGFEKGRSVVTNALPHVGAAVVVRMDVRDFFTTTTARRVEKYFRTIGWGREPARLLTKLCTHGGGLPQGAPTSPRLANLLNVPLDTRLAALARSRQAAYSRYADDLTFSVRSDDRAAVNAIHGATKRVLKGYGYTLHQKKKLRISRPHEQQRVTGLVVNERVNLPRSVRRWLRAVEHRHATGGDATLSEQQLAGWRAYRRMIEKQAGPHSA